MKIGRGRMDVLHVLPYHALTSKTASLDCYSRPSTPYALMSVVSFLGILMLVMVPGQRMMSGGMREIPMVLESLMKQERNVSRFSASMELLLCNKTWFQKKNPT